jgi:hypothetical protein
MAKIGELPLYCLDGPCTKSVSRAEYLGTGNSADERVIQFTDGEWIHGKASLIFS